MRSTACATGLALALALAADPAAAATTVYKGTGQATSTYALLPLAGGGAAVQLTNSSALTVSPAEGVGILLGECAGIGYLPEGAGSLTGTLYCTFEKDAENGFDVRGEFARGEGGRVEVIGGRGRWKGATGDGRFEAKFTQGNSTTFDYEFRITTP